MISYPEANYVKKFSEEASEKTRELPLYMGGPAVNYTKALHAYALNATLLHDALRTPDEVTLHGPSKNAEILLVERAGGHGVVGSFSGVSGYIDTLRDPESKKPQEEFDPIWHTLQEEFRTECGIPNLSDIDFRAGTPTVEARTITPGAYITVVPLLGLCIEKPEIVVDGIEVASYKWIGLEAIRRFDHRLARGYRNVTLPAALGAIGLQGEAFSRLTK